jgi:hypothetical protein
MASKTRYEETVLFQCVICILGRPEYIQFSVDRQHLVRVLCKALHYVKVAGLEQLANEVLTRSQDAREVGDEVVDVYKEIVSQARQRRLCTCNPSTHDHRSRLQDGRNGRGANPRGAFSFSCSFQRKPQVICSACGCSNWGMHLSKTTRFPAGSPREFMNQGCNSEILQ